MKYLIFFATCLPVLASAQGYRLFAQEMSGQLGAKPKVEEVKTEEGDFDISKEQQKHGRTAEELFDRIDPMFPKDSAATTFAKEVTFGGNTSVGTFDETAGVRVKPTPKAAKKGKDGKSLISDKFKNPYPKTRDEIIEAIGDPSEDTPLKAVESAPPGFQGMLASLQAGDQELALSYARQYVRYVKSVGDQLTTVSRISRVARQLEGMAPPPGEEDEGSDEYAELVRKDLEKIRGESEDGLYISQLDPQAKALLNKAAEQERRGMPRATAVPSREEQFPTGFEPDFNEAKERMKVRQSLASRNIPIDRNGEAQIFLFFNPSDKKSRVMAQQVEILKARTSDITVEGVVPWEGFTGPEAVKFAEAEKITFPIKGNLKLFARLGITEYPSTVVVAPSTGKFVLEEGFRPFYYLDELVKAVQGFQARTRE